MKQTYFQPQTKVELAECEIIMLATSTFDNIKDSQTITPSNDEYNGEFAVKEYTFGDDFAD